MVPPQTLVITPTLDPPVELFNAAPMRLMKLPDASETKITASLL